MTTHITKTWIEDGKLITEVIPESAIYKKNWISLTDDEINASSKGHMTRNGFARAVEAKLKEKNA